MSARDPTRLLGRPTRRSFLIGATAAVAAVLSPLDPTGARAEPQRDEVWIANHVPTHLVDSEGMPAAWLPALTRLRVLRVLRSFSGWIEVWVPRLGLVGRVAAGAIGPVPAPSPDELAAERQQPGPPVLASVSLPGRVVGGANLRSWPAARSDTYLRTLGHNASVRVSESVEGDDGDAWHRVDLLDGGSTDAFGAGYVHGSLVRLPRLRPAASPDLVDRMGRWLEADLREPAMLVALEAGAPVWASLSLKGRAASSTRPGTHRILRRVEHETMNSETLAPPVPRDAPGGYYLTHVLWTQYFLSDGSSIHYNYWSSNWGYAGSNGCLGLPHHEAKFVWDFADVGTPVRIFA